MSDRDNEFFKMGKVFTDGITVKQILKGLGYLIAPKVMKYLKIALIDPKSSKFFRELVSGTMAIREEKNIIRQDMIHLLMQARKGMLTQDAPEENNDSYAAVEETHVSKPVQIRKWTDDELTAQAVIFFLAGFDTISTLLCFASHELAINKDIQVRLQNEIDECVETFGIPSYEQIHRLNYLDMVISESLRKWPPAHATDRVCIKPYSVTDHDGSTFTLDASQTIIIPVYAIQHDPKYWTDPEKFDPERFNDENKKHILPFTFFPFGVGPRNCIGSRFALMEAKVILFNILANFSFEVCEKTCVPLVLSKKSLLLKPDNGFWLSLKRRTIA